MPARGRLSIFWRILHEIVALGGGRGRETPPIIAANPPLASSSLPPHLRLNFESREYIIADPKMITYFCELPAGGQMPGPLQ